VIVDLFSRLVVGWAMAATEDAELTELALRMAVARRHPGSDEARIILIQGRNLPQSAIKSLSMTWALN